MTRDMKLYELRTMMQSRRASKMSMNRDMKLYELRMLVLGYMQAEDKQKAAEAFAKWQAALKGDENE